MLGLEVPRRGQGGPALAATSAGPEANRGNVQGTPKPGTACREFGKVSGGNHSRPYVWKSHRKQLGKARRLGVGGVSVSLGPSEQCALKSYVALADGPMGQG